MMKRFAVPALALAIPALAAADALTDIRTTLGQLGATAPLHATLEVSSTARSDEDEKPESGKASVGVEADASGLHIVYPRTTLMLADQEARGESIDPERPTPTRNGVRRVRPLHVAELVDGASALSVTLEGAALTGARPSNYHGKPARLLTFKLAPKISKATSKHLKKFEGSLSLWVGEDGIPLAAERTIYVKASFLLMSFESNHKENLTYTHLADRLVVTQFEETDKTDGMGQHTSSQVTEVLRIE
jgi:hypothetical protein